MAARFESWIGSRYVRARSSNSFVSLISAISMLGIAIAVLVLIVVMSVVNGFERELKDRLLAMTAHASIEGVEGELGGWQDLQATAAGNARVTASAPYVSGQALMVFGEQLSGGEIRGIDPPQEDAVSGVGDTMIEGKLDSLAAGEFNIVLGVELADALEVDVGDKVTVVIPQVTMTVAGSIPRLKRFTVSGLFEVGMGEYDRGVALVHIADAARLQQLGDAVSGVGVFREYAQDLAHLLRVDDAGFP